ncbi:MAG: InlB B-repeat-containing protein, partial [Christensenellales bacterium]
MTVVFTPTDQHGYRTAETTIKVNVIKNTFKRCEEPDPITEKKLGTTFAGLNLPETVVVEAIDGLRVGMEVSWEESSYDAQSTAWQTIPGKLVFDANDEQKYQQPEPAVTAAIRVKLIGPEDAPAITTTTLPGGTVGTPYHHQLQATGGGFILWELFSGELPDGLTLKQTTGEISGTPTAEQTAQFTVRALNSVGNDKKELSITITNALAAEHTVTVKTDGNGTASASPSTASVGTYITLTAQPNADYRFKEWQVVSGNVTIANDKFAMPDGNVEIKAIFEQDAILTPVEHGVIVTTDGNGTASASPATASNGTEITLTAQPNAGYHFKEWQVVSGGVTIANNKFAMPDRNVEINAIFEQDAPPAPVEYAIIVTTDGNGTASANTSTASTGTEITLTAAPNAGYHFKEWQVVSGGVTIANNKFAMPDGSVMIKAIFEQDAPPAPVECIVTFDGNGGTPSVGSMTTTGQQLAALPGASRSGSYSFDGWYTQKSGGEKITTDTAFSANTAVYAHWTYTGGDDPSVAYYTLRFETGGGSDIASVRAKRDTYIDLTGYAPTWRGHTFIGWYSDRSLTNRVSGVYLTKHTTVYAGWRADESTGTGANPFTDVSEMDWFYGDVMFVYE